MPLAGAEVQQGIVLGKSLSQNLRVPVQLGQMVVERQSG